MPRTPAIEITYCRLCGWGLRAGWTAQELLATFAEEIGSVVLTPDTTGGVFEVRLDGELVELPLKEFQLLAELMNQAGYVVTREDLINRVWGYDYIGDTKTLDVHIKRLRSKLENDAADPKLITTIRGLGYKLTAP